MRITLNGAERELEALPTTAALDQLVEALGLKADRIAVELNGDIAPRSTWDTVEVHEGDRLEIVHFVGGGAGDRA